MLHEEKNTMQCHYMIDQIELPCDRWDLFGSETIYIE